jgi:hypothetical protein
MKFIATAFFLVAAIVVAVEAEHDQQDQNQSLRGLKKVWIDKPGNDNNNAGGNGNGSACGTYKGSFLEDCPSEEAGCTICTSPGQKPKRKCVSVEDAANPNECLPKKPDPLP